jgi:hypothetical protein
MRNAVITADRRPSYSGLGVSITDDPQTTYEDKRVINVVRVVLHYTAVVLIHTLLHELPTFGGLFAASKRLEMVRDQRTPQSEP